MAGALADPDPVQTVIIVAMVVTLVVVLALELKILRTRRLRRAGEGDLPDRAHNAVLTSKSIAESLGRGGVRSEPAEDAIREAEQALRMRHYRVAVELSERARALLRTAKQQYEARGDLSKLDVIAAKQAPAVEETAEERLTRELPPNYMPAKFSMNLAREQIDAAKAGGRDTAEAERHLASAQGSFEAEAYDEALRHAVRARRAVEETTPEAPPAAVTPPPSQRGRVCPSCGAPVAADDAFCRKCGTRMPEPRTCTSCGADVAADDPFCRKCGTEVV